MSFLPKLTRRTAYTGEKGIYGYWTYKREVCEDCQHRCVYCDLHANSLGGYSAMELDHFRPKAKSFFPHLKEDPLNLLLSCRSCNGKKRDDWPAGTKTDDTHVNGAGYVDPFDDRQLYFEVSPDGCLLAKQPPAKYVIDQLALNRPLAVSVRNKLIVLRKLKSAAEQLKQEITAACATKDMKKIEEMTQLLIRIIQLIVDMSISQGPAI